MSHSQQRALLYSPNQHNWLHRLGVRRAILVSVFLSIVVAGIVWGPGAMRRVQLLFWQSQCMTCTLDAGAIVTEPNNAWARFYEVLSGSPPDCNGTAFVNERISPKGQRRLVVIDLHRSSDVEGLLANPRIFVPGGMFTPPREILNCGGELWLPPSAQVRGGQPDPRDASHFTIAYESGEWQGVIDGWLGDDDRIKLEPRDPLASGR